MRDDLLDAVLGAQSAMGDGRLRQREAGARDVGRLLGDDRGAGGHDDFGDLGLGGERRRPRAPAGVRPKPARTSTLSLTISSCARRLVLSGTPASSLRMTSIFLPATVSPCCAMKSSTAASICLPVDACGPVIGRMTPILTVSCAERAAGGERADGERRNRAGRISEHHWVSLRFLCFVF